MDIEIIISTMNNNIDNFDIKQLNLHKVTIINQIPDRCDNKSEEFNIGNIKWINVDQKGLSKSRNLALEITSSDYIYLTDDDVVLNDKFKETVIDSIESNPAVDILAFQVSGIERKFKEYSSEEIDINYINSMKLSSVQLVMKSDFIKKNNLYYDELFGTGSKYRMGEENIFLFDALKKSAKIKYIPREIAKVHLGESSWFNGFNEKYFFDRGAVFYRMFENHLARLYCILFCLRKYKLYSNEINFIKAYKQMIKGMKDIENVKKSTGNT